MFSSNEKENAIGTDGSRGEDVLGVMVSSSGIALLSISCTCARVEGEGIENHYTEIVKRCYKGSM